MSKPVWEELRAVATKLDRLPYRSENVKEAIRLIRKVADDEESHFTPTPHQEGEAG